MKTFQITVEEKDSAFFLKILQNLKFIKHIQESDTSVPVDSMEYTDEDAWTEQDWQEFDQELADRRKRFSSFKVEDL